MATAKWTTPSTRSSNFAGTTLNSLANGSESAQVTYNNASNKDLYGSVTVKLGSITPGTAPTITLRVGISDGTDTADRGFDLYTQSIVAGAGAKVFIFPMVRLYPFSMRL